MAKRKRFKPASPTARAPRAPYIEAGIRWMAVPVDSVHPDPENARHHTPANLAAIRGSLAGARQQTPIVVDRYGMILKGNGTWHAAKALGWDYIAVLLSTLYGADARAYSLADNRTAELAEWDETRLAEQLAELRAEGSIDLTTLGWSDEEAQEVLNLAAGLGHDTNRGPDMLIDRRDAGPLVKAVFAPSALALVEQALGMTGLVNRGKALEAVCRFYIEAVTDAGTD